MSRKKHQRPEEVEAIDYGEESLVSLIADAQEDFLAAHDGDYIPWDELAIIALDVVRKFDRHRMVKRG